MIWTVSRAHEKTVEQTSYGNHQKSKLRCTYLLQLGVVLAQMRVDEKSHEITHALKLLSQLDLSGVVVSGTVNQKVEPRPGALSTPTCP